MSINTIPRSKAATGVLTKAFNKSVPLTMINQVIRDFQGMRSFMEGKEWEFSIRSQAGSAWDWVRTLQVTEGASNPTSRFNREMSCLKMITEGRLSCLKIGPRSMLIHRGLSWNMQGLKIRRLRLRDHTRDRQWLLLTRDSWIVHQHKGSTTLLNLQLKVPNQTHLQNPRMMKSLGLFRLWCISLGLWCWSS